MAKDKTYYYCDPFKNTECSKTSCFLRGGSCELTNKIEYAMLNGRGLPVEAREEKEEHGNT